MNFSEGGAAEVVENADNEVVDNGEQENPEFVESDESDGGEVVEEEEVEIEENDETNEANANEDLEVENAEEQPADPEAEGDITDDDREHEGNEEVEEDDTTTLTEGEREEFEALKAEVQVYRRKDKLGLIESFKGHLSKAFLEDLENRVDEFSLDELDITLSKEFTRLKKENESKPSAFIPFSNKTNSIEQESYAERMKRLVNELK